jgi:hypothetical protein
MTQTMTKSLKVIHFFLTEAFPLLDTLKALIANNDGLRAQVMEVRNAVATLNPSKINNIASHFYDSIDVDSVTRPRYRSKKSLIRLS